MNSFLKNFTFKTLIVLLIFGSCILILNEFKLTENAAVEQSMSLVRSLQGSAFLPDTNVETGKYQMQRNKLSKMLNSVKQELSQMSCEMIEMKKQHQQHASRVSVTGGWCKKTSYANSGRHAFDAPLAEALSSLFANQSVASFGDGPGSYKKYIDATKKVLRYDAFDGAPYGPETSGGLVKFMDLTAPQFGLPLYDWVISLEVAEHIPAQYESIYIDNIIRHARHGIVLSWAVPGQSGLSHVNNKPKTYVQRLLSGFGFEPDHSASDTLRTKATLPWLRQNVYAYRRRSNTANPADG